MSVTQQLLEHAKANTSGRGIFTASRYLSDMVGCLSGGACPTQMWSLDSEDAWSKALEQSTKTLTATDPDWTFDDKSFGTEKGFILTASGIMSTSNMDTDKDILDAKGGSVETMCPYLWHHMAAVPVGKVLSTSLSTVKSGNKDVDAILFKCGILDIGNGLGRDTALLIEMNALRNSHGFEALDASPIKGAGWHVKKYRTFEISGVTLPANTDAVFSEFSKEKSKFTSGQVRTWIKGHYDERAKSWKGYDPQDLKKNLTLEVGVVFDTEQVEVAAAKIAKVIDQIQDKYDKLDEHTCSCQKNRLEVVADDEIAVKKSEWEEMKQKLSDFETAKETAAPPVEVAKELTIVRVVDPVLASLGL